MFTSQTGCLSNFVEQDGCARTVIVLLLLTTVGCMSYTWGYYEGIANSQSNLMLDKLHQMQLAEMAAKGVNETAKRHHGGHGMRLAEAVEVGRGERGLSTTHQASHHDLSLELTDGTANAAAAATLEDAAAHAEEASATPARNSGGVGTAAVRRSGRKQKAGRPAEGGT